MQYCSTRNKHLQVNSKDAIIHGLSTEGGLYIPQEIPSLDYHSLLGKSYKEMAKQVCGLYFSDFSKEEINHCIEKGYTDHFDVEEIVPLKKLNNSYLLELFHGETCAFKDIALSLLPHFLTTAYESKNENKTICILTATSGDTGKAALESFKDVPHTAIQVFYPDHGVSKVQELQMKTTKGNNVSVTAIQGNFDDCQRLVKESYQEKSILNASDNVILSSANSINIGRLVPQIVYYFKAYVDLIQNNEIKEDEEINFSVPTGNFGDILAGYFAKQMGLPIHKLICASNENNVLTDFLKTGIYDRNRDFYTTISPSMDILVSSNLERLLYLIENDDVKVNSYMQSLNENGKYEMEQSSLQKIQDSFIGYYASEEECKNVIHDQFETDHVVLDPHTAVAMCCKEKYYKEHHDEHVCVVLATASPYKFATDTLQALNGEIENDAFQAMKKIQDLSNTAIPKNLAVLPELEIRFKDSIDVKDGFKEIIHFIERVFHD